MGRLIYRIKGGIAFTVALALLLGVACATDLALRSGGSTTATAGRRLQASPSPCRALYDHAAALSAPVAKPSPAGTNASSTDFYAWLRDDSRQSSVVLDYLRAENEYAAGVLQAVEATVEQLRDEMTARLPPPQTATTPLRRGGFFYYKRLLRGGDTYMARFRRPVPPGAPPPSEADEMDPSQPEQLVLDPNRFCSSSSPSAASSPSSFCDIYGVKVSPDDKLVAFGVDTTGREHFDLVVVEIESQRVLLDRGAVIDTSASYQWSADSNSLLFVTVSKGTNWPYRLSIIHVDQLLHADSSPAPAASTGSGSGRRRMQQTGGFLSSLFGGSSSSSSGGGRRGARGSGRSSIRAARPTADDYEDISPMRPRRLGDGAGAEGAGSGEFGAAQGMRRRRRRPGMGGGAGGMGGGAGGMGGGAGGGQRMRFRGDSGAAGAEDGGAGGGMGGGRMRAGGAGDGMGMRRRRRRVGGGLPGQGGEGAMGAGATGMPSGGGAGGGAGMGGRMRAGGGQRMRMRRRDGDGNGLGGGMGGAGGGMGGAGGGGGQRRRRFKLPENLVTTSETTLGPNAKKGGGGFLGSKPKPKPTSGTTLGPNALRGGRQLLQGFSSALWRAKRATTLLLEEPDPSFELHLSRTSSGAFIVVYSKSEDTNEVRLFNASNPTAPPVATISRRTGFWTLVSHRRDQLLLLRRTPAEPNSYLAAVPLPSGPRNLVLRADDEVAVLVPHRPGVEVEDFEVTADAAVLMQRIAGRVSFAAVDLQGAHTITPALLTAATVAADNAATASNSSPSSSFASSPSPTPSNAGSAGWAMTFQDASYSASIDAVVSFEHNILGISYSSFLTPPLIIDVNLATRKNVTRPESGGGSSSSSGASAFDRSLYDSLVLNVPSSGASVPVSLVYRRGAGALRRDGGSPLVLQGYGAYGAKSDPSWSSDVLSLLDRGFIVATAHVRGGGELGYGWYTAGKLTSKKNSFNDLVAVAEYLIAQRFTSAGRLALWGRSAGGLLMAAALNLRPQLFGAAVLDVPFVDVLNEMMDPTLPLTAKEWGEWGNPVDDPAARDYIASYSPLQNVRRAAYPPILVTAALNDPRVSYWGPAKYVARLRATKTDSNPLLLRTDLGAGHFSNAGYDSARHATAVKYAFMLHLLTGQGSSCNPTFAANWNGANSSSGNSSSSGGGGSGSPTPATPVSKPGTPATSLVPSKPPATTAKAPQAHAAAPAPATRHRSPGWLVAGGVLLGVAAAALLTAAAVRHHRGDVGRWRQGASKLLSQMSIRRSNYSQVDATAPDLGDSNLGGDDDAVHYDTERSRLRSGSPMSPGTRILYGKLG